MEKPLNDCMKIARSICILTALFVARPAAALDPAMRISQYRHTAWRMQDGLFAGVPHVVAQTADGYIWVGTDVGLMRFDGIRFVPWEPPDKRKTMPPVYSLLGRRNGEFWIGTALGVMRV